MITAKKQNVSFKGEGSRLLAEYSAITSGLVDALEKNGIPKEVTKEMVNRAHCLGLMSEEELKKEAIKSANRLLQELQEKLLRECEEEEKVNE